MFGRKKINETEAKLAALDKSQAVIEFSPDGAILTANNNFLSAMGYTLVEIKGKHHSIFVENDYRDSPDYVDFWKKLRGGQAQVATFKRIGKDGREVWIEASYNPLMGPDGKPHKVIKYAIDVTDKTQEYADLRGQVQAIHKSQAVISFAMDGTILEANENFLRTLGYTLDEIKGKHHSMFVEPATRDSRDYAEFWRKLRDGQFQAAQYKRLGKGGREVWIEASYNPILDPSGKPYKVVKFATDITAQVQLLANLKQLIDQNFTELDSAIGQTSQQAGAANHAASETLSNVQMVASAAEELAASVAEISQSMAKSRAASDGAFERVNAAGDSTQRLAEAVLSMGGIVSLIQNIAGQINLLALNATIESARAGEAGKGFAVVANEVKALAQQTHKATEEIRKQIDGLQHMSTEVIDVLGTIKNSITKANEFSSNIAAAIEEQTAVTNEIAGNMSMAAQGVEDINTNIVTVSSSSQQASQSTSKVLDSAKNLFRQSESLGGEIQSFLKDIQAA